MKRLLSLAAAVLLAALPAFADNGNSQGGIGNSGQTILGYRNENAATVASTEGYKSVIATNRYGHLMCSLAGGTAAATNPVKLEDSAHTTADAGVFALAVRNTGNNALTNTDADYSPISVSQYGAVFADISYNQVQSASQSILKQEDAATGTGDVGVASLVKLQSALSVDAAANDYGTLKADLDGRIISSNAPAGEMFTSCSDAETGTADNLIKAAVASNRMYITDISCDNTANVSSAIVFEDGETEIWRGGIPSSTLAGVGVYRHNFTTPLRGTSNTLFDYAMVTPGTSTTCCISGYVSVN